MDDEVRVLVLEDVVDGETVEGLAAAAEDLAVATAPGSAWPSSSASSRPTAGT